jgi:hypothetical protein
MGFGNAENLEKRSDIFRHLLQGVRPIRNLRAPMAPGVIAKNPVSGLQDSHLRIPHGEVCGQRVTESHDRR